MHKTNKEMRDDKEALTLQETQQIALEILHTVARICEEQDLRYYLVYGTLIGAVRHHGFIPWDDDVDIMMPRPDHDRLMEYLDDHIGEYPHLQVFNRKTCPEYPYMITRISDDRYEIRMENEKPFGMGVFIDIYPYDGLGNEKREAIRFGLKGDRLSSLCYQAGRDHFAIETTTSPLRKLIKYPVYLLCRRVFLSAECAASRHTASPPVTNAAEAIISSGAGVGFSEPKMPKKRIMNEITAASAQTEPTSVSHTAFRLA